MGLHKLRITWIIHESYGDYTDHVVTEWDGCWVVVSFLELSTCGLELVQGKLSAAIIVCPVHVIQSAYVMDSLSLTLRTRIVHSNDYYMGIDISITGNILSWDVISITIN